MTQFRIAWEPCPDCGRSSDRPGGCFVVERKGWFGWKPYLVTYDRGGRAEAEHFRSHDAARHAYDSTLQPSPGKIVCTAWTQS